MDAKTFAAFRDYIYSVCGITLGENKESLVSARIGKRMRVLGFTDPRQYLEHVKADPQGPELVEMLDAISTNVTSFFREPQHFIFLERIIRDWLARGQRRFRLWCAAASSGEEPYTIAMTLQEAGALEVDTRVLCTDISTKVLALSQRGIYAENRMNGISAERRHRYFTKDPDGWRVADTLRKPLTFTRLNLATPPYPMHGPLDVVFCRNVMIYFDNPVRQRLLDEVNRLLKPGGYLIVGHAESLTGLLGGFRSVQPAVYQRP
ncbi:MAG: protein-glutamate O-methyltransferase CheR [Planctomycetota bacterium]|nr:MAG: protein-glutamate O-methyltransferase CheR [Planctomycetota bacterium]